MYLFTILDMCFFLNTWKYEKQCYPIVADTEITSIIYGCFYFKKKKKKWKKNQKLFDILY